MAEQTQERIVGIDLGTTNSLVAYMQGEKPVVIPGEDGLNLVPSVVALAGDGQRKFVVVSAHAEEELIADPHFQGMERTEGFVLVEITLRSGRTTEKKQALYREIARLFAERAAIAPDNVMIVLRGNELDDWSFGRGEAQYVLNPPAAAR